MFVKYVMSSPKDYRGNVKLIVRNEQRQEIAYSKVETVDADMIELIENEVTLVKEKTDGQWLDLRSELKYKIDMLADEIRKSYLEAGYTTIDLEYIQVENVLNEWEAKGKPSNDVPEDITVWKEVTGKDLEWTVSDIRAAINDYRQTISGIRRIRLTAKRDLDSASISTLKSVYDQAVQDLEALRLIPAP